MKLYRAAALTAFLSASILLAACGGGGGGGPLPPSGGPSSHPTATPTPTPTPIPKYTMSGTVVHCDSTWIGTPPTSPSPEPTAAPCNPGTGIAGATVTVGAPAPSSAPGVPGGTPASPTLTTTTAADGSWTIANVPAGQTEIQVTMPAGQPCTEGAYPNNISATPSPTAVAFADSGNYAVYNGQISLSANTTVPTIHLTSLTQDEWCWYQQEKSDISALIGSTSNTIIDETSEEIARAQAVGLQALLLASGQVQVFPQFQTQYQTNGGLWTYADGYVAGNQSWQAAEYEALSQAYAGPAWNGTKCQQYAGCAAVAKPSNVYVGAAENASQTDFVFVGISH